MMEYAKSSNRIDRSPSALAGHYELVVIGGGVTGVCVAREVAARGRSVLLLEKGDFGSGTSSATTKYLHGGIRYLEQYDVALVRESLRERRRFALAAPHLVSQMPFVLPVWDWTSPGRWMLGAGAAAYDILSFDRNRGMPDSLRIGHPRWLNKAKTLSTVPWLQPQGLRGSVVITDTLNIHPERLLLALVLDAVALGAVAINHAEVTGFDVGEDGRTSAVQAVHVRDNLTGEDHRVRTDRVVNAGGPWVGEVLKGLNRSIGISVQPSKGVHFLTGHHAKVTDVAVMARARSGRHVVVSPWQNRYLIGPTDTPVESRPDDVTVVRSDVEELLAVVNDCRHPDQQLAYDDVDETTIGLRPLIGDANTADSSKLSRGHQIQHHAKDGVDGLYSIIGGKWTTGRAIAEDATNVVFGKDVSRTRSRPVADAPGWGVEPAGLLETLNRNYKGVCLLPGTLEHLVRLYGSRAALVLDVAAANPHLIARISDRPGCNDILAQVVVAITDEGAKTLEDIVQRRLILGTLGSVRPKELAAVAAVAAPLLGWEDAGVAELDAEVTRRSLRHAGWQRS